MLRSVGALIFGSISDRYGRKWVMIANLTLFIVFELASGFCNTLSEFLGVRALYGIAMGVSQRTTRLFYAFSGRSKSADEPMAAGC